MPPLVSAAIFVCDITLFIIFYCYGIMCTLNTRLFGNLSLVGDPINLIELICQMPFRIQRMSSL
jgi:hypothetical protein